MLQTFDKHDQVLNQSRFVADEVPYNLIHLLSESQTTTCLKTSEDSMILARSEGFNSWLWMAEDIEEEKKDEIIQELIISLQETRLVGISGAPATAERFAQLYGEANGLIYRQNMLMESYYCPEVKKPLVAGEMQQASSREVETVAEFLAGFSEGAFGVSVEPASQIPAAERMIETGSLYFWMVDNRPVSMAQIAHRSPRHARINAVYTPVALRKRGYASAIVAEICSLLKSEGRIAMLYADMKNPDSNKVYQNIGFVESGKIVDIKFK